MAKKSTSSSMDRKSPSHKYLKEKIVNDKFNISVSKKTPERSAFLWLILVAVLSMLSSKIHHYQFRKLPIPLSAEQVGKRGFSELSAMNHVKALTKLGPHPVGSDALDLGVEYVLKEARKIKENAHWEVGVEVELFHSQSGANCLREGLFKGRTLVYSDLKHVVHIGDSGARNIESHNPSSYISVFSTTPGKLTREMENLKEEGFICGRENPIDFVTFNVGYSCWSFTDTKSGWSETDIPVLHVENDLKTDTRTTRVFIDTKVSSRWTVGINMEEIEEFNLETTSKELVPVGNKIKVNGWHIIQVSGGRNSPRKFHLTLYWGKKSTSSQSKVGERRSNILLKLRTDVNRVTPKVVQVLNKLPPWCSQYGKSTSPLNLAFLSSLPLISNVAISFLEFSSF